jgi:hypothetical protein
MGVVVACAAQVPRSAPVDHHPAHDDRLRVPPTSELHVGQVPGDDFAQAQPSVEGRQRQHQCRAIGIYLWPCARVGRLPDRLREHPGHDQRRREDRQDGCEGSRFRAHVRAAAFTPRSGHAEMSSDLFRCQASNGSSATPQAARTWLPRLTGLLPRGPIPLAARVWVPNWSSTVVTCGIAGRWSSGMIVAQAPFDVVQVQAAGLVDPQADLGHQPGGGVVAGGPGKLPAARELLAPAHEQGAGCAVRRLWARAGGSPHRSGTDHAAGQLVDLNLCRREEREVRHQRLRPSQRGALCQVLHDLAEVGVGIGASLSHNGSRTRFAPGPGTRRRPDRGV